MVKQHSQLMLVLLMAADAAAIACAWFISYWLRFAFLPVDPGKGVPELWDKYAPMLPLVIAAHLFIFIRVRLYRPRRDGLLIGETRDILKAFCVAIVAIVLIDYALPATNKISRQFIFTYAVVGSTCFAAFRALARGILHAFRRRGWNRRAAVIVGSGRTAQRLLAALRRNSWTGYQVAYFVDDPPRKKTGDGGDAAENATRAAAGPGRTAAQAIEDAVRGQTSDQASEAAADGNDGSVVGEVRGVPLRGPLRALHSIVEAHPADAIFIALSQRQAHRTREVFDALSTCMADVRLVPEVSGSYAMRPDVSDLEGLAILSLRQTPLRGWNAIVKRGFDLIVGSICLLIGGIPMLIVAAAIKLTSPGPVFYRQRRMGMDGVEFQMLKFRSMRIDAEAGGPVWSRKADSRRTVIGGFLRRTSLDELPNLFNVLRGEMSLVGPRPERPEFVSKFKHEIEHYMLRHKIKAGMTGYAQMKGLRGDTSLRKRIRHDLHYIRHWSVWLDVRILFNTVFGVWFSKHEA